jgi:hypothetical protein
VISLLVGLVVAGCGSSTPTASSPAPLAPTHSLLYLELTVRPQGAQRDAAESALTKLLGQSPDAALEQAATKLLSQLGLNYTKDVQPWLGQKIALVLTSLSRAGLGLIAPTDNTSAAMHALRKPFAGHLRPASYAGVNYEIGRGHSEPAQPLALGIVGQDAVIAAPPVFRDIVDAYHGSSLTNTTDFASAFASLPSSALVKAYVNASRLGPALREVMGSAPARAGASGSVRHLIVSALGKLRGALGFSLSASPHSLSIDLHSTVVHSGASADVRALPGKSWLAVASTFNPARIIPLLSALSHEPGFGLTLASIHDRLGLDLIHDVLPALGPFELSVQGTSALTLGAGLVVKPSDPAAAQRVLAAVRRLVGRSSSLVVQGTKRSFSITKPGLPIPRVLVAQTRRHVVVTFDQDLSQLLSPSTHLATNPRFTAALAQLPAGSRVSLFIDFRALSQLLGALPSFASGPSMQRLASVVQRLDYVVLGSNSADGETRLVLGLR